MTTEELRAECAEIICNTARGNRPRRHAEALLIALDALERNAIPALGGKLQQYDAQAALSEMEKLP